MESLNVFLKQSLEEFTSSDTFSDISRNSCKDSSKNTSKNSFRNISRNTSWHTSKDFSRNTSWYFSRYTPYRCYGLSHVACREPQKLLLEYIQGLLKESLLWFFQVYLQMWHRNTFRNSSFEKTGGIYPEISRDFVVTNPEFSQDFLQKLLQTSMESSNLSVRLSVIPTRTPGIPLGVLQRISPGIYLF